MFIYADDSHKDILQPAYKLLTEVNFLREEVKEKKHSY